MDQAPPPSGEPAIYQMRLPSPDSLEPRAEAGDLEAQFYLSQTLAWGPPQDFKASEHWLRRAANAGYVPAQFDLGIGLGMGSGATGRLPRDPVEGMMWLIIASRQESDQRWRIDAVRSALRRLMKPEEVQEAERRAQLPSMD